MLCSSITFQNILQITKISERKKVYDMNTEILENKTATALISAVKQINEKHVRRRASWIQGEHCAWAIAIQIYLIRWNPKLETRWKQFEEGLTVYLYPQETSVWLSSNLLGKILHSKLAISVNFFKATIELKSLNTYALLDCQYCSASTL